MKKMDVKIYDCWIKVLKIFPKLKTRLKENVEKQWVNLDKLSKKNIYYHNQWSKFFITHFNEL